MWIVHKTVFIVSLMFILALTACSSGKDAVNDGREDEAKVIGDEGYERPVKADTPDSDIPVDRIQPDDDFTEPGSADAVREESARRHDEIDYTKPNFHPGDFPDVETMEFGEKEDGVRSGEFEILYNNGFSEKGLFLGGVRQGPWKIYNRNQELIRIDQYEEGERTSYEIIK